MTFTSDSKLLHSLAIRSNFSISSSIMIDSNIPALIFGEANDSLIVLSNSTPILLPLDREARILFPWLLLINFVEFSKPLLYFSALLLDIFDISSLLGARSLSFKTAPATFAAVDKFFSLPSSKIMP